MGLTIISKPGTVPSHTHTHSTNQYLHSQKESMHFGVLKDKIYLRDYPKEVDNRMNHKLCYT